MEPFFSIKLVISYSMLIVMGISFIPQDILSQQSITFDIPSSRKVNSLCFSSDSKYLVSGHSNKSINIWNLDENICEKTYKIADLDITSALYSIDQQQIITSSIDKKLRIVSMEENHIINMGDTGDDHTAAIYSTSLSEDGKYLISCGRDTTIRLWDLKTTWLQKVYKGHSDEITSVAFDATGQYFVSGSSDKLVILWSISSNVPLKIIGSHNRAVNDVRFTPDGKWIISAGSDSLIKIWDVQTAKLNFELKGHNNVVNCVAVSKDGKTLVSGGNDCITRIWDITTGDEISKISISKTYIETALISPDNKTIAFGTYDGLIYLYDKESGSFISILDAEQNYISAFDVSNKGNFVISASITGHTRSWDLSTGRSKSVFTDNTSCISSISISPDDQYVALGCFDNSIKIYSIKSDKVVNTLSEHIAEVTSVIFSRNNKFLISASIDKSVIFWDFGLGFSLKHFKYEKNSITAIEFDETNNVLYIGDSEGFLCKWDLDETSPMTIIKAHNGRINNLKKLHNSELIASCSDDKLLKIWLSSDLSHFGKGQHNWFVSSLDISNDDSFIATGSYDGYVRQWYFGNLENKSKATDLIQPLSENDNMITGLEFTKDNKFLLSSSVDGAIKVYDLQKGLITTMRSIDESEYIIYTPDNYYTASKQGLKYVNFKELNKEYPLLQFDIKYNRPDIVVSRLGYAKNSLVSAYERAYERRLKNLNINKSILEKEFNIPEIKITYSNVSGKQMTLTIYAEDNRYRIDKLNVFVNGVPIFGRYGKSLIDKRTSRVAESVVFELSNGKNLIEASICNELGVESLRESMQYLYEPDITEKPDLYLLTIGISTYSDKRFGLNYSTLDAEMISSFILTSGTSQKKYNNIYVLNLYDKDATKNKILLSRNFLSQAQVNDNIIVFISTQGILDKKLNYYLTPYDMNFFKPSKKGISIDEIENILDGINSRNKILLIQTSNSGEKDDEEIKIEQKELKLSPCESFANLGTEGILKVCTPRSAALLQGNSQIGLKNSIELMQELFVNVSRGSGTVIIFATGGVEYAVEKNNIPQSIFASSIMDALNDSKADISKDGIITVSELQEYISDRVKNLTENRQKVSVKQENINNDFFVW